MRTEPHSHDELRYFAEDLWPEDQEVTPAEERASTYVGATMLRAILAGDAPYSATELRRAAEDLWPEDQEVTPVEERSRRYVGANALRAVAAQR